MENRIARFIAGLRASGVRVSVAESQDAWRAITYMGVTDRENFKLSLRSTLIKDGHDIPIFEELFPMYFGLGAPPLLNPQAELSEEEQQILQEFVEELAGDLQELLNWLLSGIGPTPEELADLADQAGMENADSPFQQRWYARRMQRLLGWDQLQDILEMLWEWLAEQGMSPQQIAQLQQQVGQNAESLEEQLEQYAGQRIQDNRVDQHQQRLDNAYDLMERPFGSLNETELDVLREQIARLAARLRSRAALRQKRANKGKLDAKATMRANQKYGGVPVELKLKRRRLKPRLVVFVDVSQSMRPVVEFFLRMVSQLQDQVQKTNSFAFYERLEDVSDEMALHDVNQAIEIIFDKFPYRPYGTDFGRGLEQFENSHMSTIDRRTTVIVLGDGRNNYNDPGIDVFEDIHRRSRKIIWMNPEYPAQWASGDSDMNRYAPLCSEVYTVRNLKELTDAVDHILG